MASPRERRWLRGELPSLVTAGVISPETAHALAAHYPEPDAKHSRGLAFIVLAAVGSTLIAAGIVLLIAHNWDALSRPARSVLAFLPLIISQSACAFVFSRRDNSQAGRASVAIFNIAAIGSAIALVSQTYQIHGAFRDFIFVWMLLSLPVVYLMRTTLGATVYCAGAALWIWNSSDWLHHVAPLPFWFLLLLIAPYCALRRGNGNVETTLLVTVLAVVLAIGIGFTASFSDAHIGALSFAGLFCLVYICGIEFLPTKTDRLHPLAVFAGIAIGIMTIVLTFQDIWTHSNTPLRNPDFQHVAALVILLLFPLAAIALVVWSLTRGRPHFSILAVALPVVTAIAWLIARLCPSEQITWSRSNCDVGAALLFDVYALALGVELIARGLRADSAARTNFGLLLIAALAIARFFDSDFSFVTRAIGFIVIGAGFLFANFLLLKKRRLA